MGQMPYGLSERTEGQQLGNGRMVGNEGQAQETQQILSTNSRLNPCVKIDLGGVFIERGLLKVGRKVKPP